MVGHCIQAGSCRTCARRPQAPNLYKLQTVQAPGVPKLLVQLSGVWNCKHTRTSWRRPLQYGHCCRCCGLSSRAGTQSVTTGGTQRDRTRAKMVMSAANMPLLLAVTLLASLSAPGRPLRRRHVIWPLRLALLGPRVWGRVAGAPLGSGTSRLCLGLQACAKGVCARRPRPPGGPVRTARVGHNLGRQKSALLRHWVAPQKGLCRGAQYVPRLQPDPAVPAASIAQTGERGARPPACPAGLAEPARSLPSGLYSIRLEQGRADCEFRGRRLGAATR